MTTYSDLSLYDYTKSEVALLNVGWLGRSSAFTTGTVDKKSRDELVKLAAEPVNIMRGLHDCELCDQESPIRIDAVDGVHGRVSLGTGEVHVSGDGETYAAPTLIIHYIDKHAYLPPERFLSALSRSVD